jgi:hypothetical protein
LGFAAVLRIGRQIRVQFDPKFLPDPDLESDPEKIIPDLGSPDPE